MTHGVILPIVIPEGMTLIDALKQVISLCRHLNVAISFVFRKIELIIHSFELEEICDSAVEYFQIYDNYRRMEHTEIMNLKQIKELDKIIPPPPPPLVRKP